MFIISVKPLEIFVIALLESFSDNSIISVIPRFFLFYFIFKLYKIVLVLIQLSFSSQITSSHPFLY